VSSSALRVFGGEVDSGAPGNIREEIHADSAAIVRGAGVAAYGRIPVARDFSPLTQITRVQRGAAPGRVDVSHRHAGHGEHDHRLHAHSRSRRWSWNGTMYVIRRRASLRRSIRPNRNRTLALRCGRESASRDGDFASRGVTSGGTVARCRRAVRPGEIIAATDRRAACRPRRGNGQVLLELRRGRRRRIAKGTAGSADEFSSYEVHRARDRGDLVSRIGGRGQYNLAPARGRCGPTTSAPGCSKSDVRSVPQDSTIPLSRLGRPAPHGSLAATSGP